MTELQKYQYATVGLSFITVVLLIFLFTSNKDDSVSDLLGQVDEQLNSCKLEIKAWSDENSSGTVSDEARAELQGILSSCQEKIAPK